MSTVYTATNRKLLFNGKQDVEVMHKDWQTDDPEARLFYKIFQNN